MGEIWYPEAFAKMQRNKLPGAEKEAPPEYLANIRTFLASALL